MVDTYVEHGFTRFSFALSRPMVSRKTRAALGYSVAEFMPFYERALAHMLALNEQGVRIAETMAAIMARHIYTPFHSGYMDLRSPGRRGPRNAGLQLRRFGLSVRRSSHGCRNRRPTFQAWRRQRDAGHFAVVRRHEVAGHGRDRGRASGLFGKCVCPIAAPTPCIMRSCTARRTRRDSGRIFASGT